LDQYAVDGPLARTAGDMILLQNVMSGPHRDDMVSIRPKLRISSEVKSLAGWKIAYSADLGFYEVSDEVRRNTETALDAFRAAGAEVEEVDLGWTADVIDSAMAHLEHLFGASLIELVDEDPESFMPYTRALADGARTSTAARFLAAGEVANGMYAELSKIFETHRLLICPTTALEAVHADCDGVSDEVLINGKRVHPLHGWIMTVPFNMLNYCPVVSAPSGRAASGVPTGVQIVGRTYRDADVCAAALAYERERGAGFAAAESRPDFRAA
ncbi:MAG: amidase family protein, partial [Pseudomonadota bacterium]